MSRRTPRGRTPMSSRAPASTSPTATGWRRSVSAPVCSRLRSSRSSIRTASRSRAWSARASRAARSSGARSTAVRRPETPALATASGVRRSWPTAARIEVRRCAAAAFDSARAAASAACWVRLAARSTAQLTRTATSTKARTLTRLSGSAIRQCSNGGTKKKLIATDPASAETMAGPRPPTSATTTVRSKKAGIVVAKARLSRSGSRAAVRAGPRRRRAGTRGGADSR